MKGLAGTSMVALGVAAFLASLSLVSWRQREALDTLTRLERLRQDSALEAAMRDDLKGRILHLESWGRVVSEAEEGLGMHVAESSEIFLLPGEDK
jgi:hypothetical protein